MDKRKSDKNTSKYISLILRHKPEAIGINLDEHGWALVDELIRGVSRTHPLDMETLERIVAEDEKQRYSFNEDRTLIRANQGLIPKSRLYVHLSGDAETARKVGQRHGRPVIDTVDAAAMRADGYTFYRSVNGVWLTKKVPAEYLRRV